MSASEALTLGKEERIVSRTLIEQLFTGGKSHAMSAFPLRMVYMLHEREESEPQAKVLVSVSKRYFKRAVKRNRVKRQIREAYRHSKSILTETQGSNPTTAIAIAFIWMDARLHSSADIDRCMASLLSRLNEKVNAAPRNDNTD